MIYISRHEHSWQKTNRQHHGETVMRCRRCGDEAIPASPLERAIRLVERDTAKLGDARGQRGIGAVSEFPLCG